MSDAGLIVGFSIVKYSNILYKPWDCVLAGLRARGLQGCGGTASEPKARWRGQPTVVEGHTVADRHSFGHLGEATYRRSPIPHIM